MNEFCAWLAAHGTSCLELVAATFGLLGVILTIPESVWNWPVGIVNVTLYFFLFIRDGYYSNAGLQLVYLVLSIYGWYEWLHGGRAKTELQVSRATPRIWIACAVVGVAGWVVLFTITKHIPGGAFTFSDAATTIASLVAEWMVARKLLENWPLWIVIDIAYVVMFIAGRNYLTALNYAGYVVLGVLGWAAWRRSIAHTAPVAA